MEPASDDLRLPPAERLPAGATVLSLSGAERKDLRRGVALYALMVGTVGVGIGYWLGYRAGRRRT